MLKPSVQLRLGQQLTMTPQLQQAIKLLQLSALELQTQIQQAIEENPLLEFVEEGDDLDEAFGVAGESLTEADPEDRREERGGVDNADRSEFAATLAEDGEHEVEVVSDDAFDHASDNPSEDIPDELAVDTTWGEIYDLSASSTGSADQDERDPFENRGGGEQDLRTYLLWQLELSALGDQDRLLALAIIDALDDDGFIGDRSGTFLSHLAKAMDVDLAEVEAVRRWLQQLDPIGCASLNLGETLAVQLQCLPADTPWRTEALLIVRKQLDRLANRDYKGIMNELAIAQGEFQQVLALIQGLNPRPGARFNQTKIEYVIPDVLVAKAKGSWRVELNAEIIPPLRINSYYASLVKRADQSADNTYLRHHLQEARWFIKSLLSRNETLLRVATAIVECQREFLDYGPEAMRPLILRDIADQLELHESTISRVTSQKYMHTPRGVFELKYFFSSHVDTADGGGCSAIAIRAMIRKLVAEEDARTPLSDSKIAEILLNRGIKVARRTVAKYREALHIPASHERRHLA